MAMFFFSTTPERHFSNLDTETQFFYYILLVDGLRTMMFLLTQESNNIKLFLMMELSTLTTPFLLFGLLLCTTLAQLKFSGTLPPEPTPVSHTSSLVVTQQD
jgi:hypothetical protein